MGWLGWLGGRRDGIAKKTTFFFGGGKGSGWDSQFFGFEDWNKNRGFRMMRDAMFFWFGKGT